MERVQGEGGEEGREREGGGEGHHARSMPRVRTRAERSC